MAKKLIVDLSEKESDINLIGKKGANLIQMTNLGLPVPSGFVLTTVYTKSYLSNNNELSTEYIEQVLRAMKKLEKTTNKTFGDSHNPLLLSIRCSSCERIKGLSPTMLCVGINDEIAQGLCEKTGNNYYGYECYARFIGDYAELVEKIDISSWKKEAKIIAFENNNKSTYFKKIVDYYKEQFNKQTKRKFPQDCFIQLFNCIKSMMDSWQSTKAINYRKFNNISEEKGFAIAVQQMILGNLTKDSCSGVAFTRDPATGKKQVYGEFIYGAIDDSSIPYATTHSLNELSTKSRGIALQFQKICEKLEHFFKDMLDIEFAVEGDSLYILQTKIAKRTPTAAVKIAVDLVKEGIINQKQALLSVQPEKLIDLIKPSFSKDALEYAVVIANGFATSPGAVNGVIALSTNSALDYASQGEPVILIRNSTNSTDMQGIGIANGVITTSGGLNTHASLVCRSMGKPCITNCEKVRIDDAKHIVRFGNLIYREGDYISFDGNTGKIYGEQLPTQDFSIKGDLLTFLNWAKQNQSITILADASTPTEMAQGMDWGAKDIGICRSEHMFGKPAPLKVLREFLVAPDESSRFNALAFVQDLQKKDFTQYFKKLPAKSISVRLLDAPLHKFLPKTKNEIIMLSRDLGKSVADIEARVADLTQVNPTLGLRGCRLGLLYPSLVSAQCKAIFEALVDCVKKEICSPKVNIVIPLVSMSAEFIELRQIVDQVATQVMQQHKTKFKYSVGCMLETPRACLLAEEVIEKADFVVFGTNDLTLLTYGISPDDSNFISEYIDRGMIFDNPFAQLDTQGVGELIKMAMNTIKKIKPTLPTAICGRQVTNPEAIKYVADLGIKYLNARPVNVPTAILANAQYKLSKTYFANDFIVKCGK